jgi:hypothetical protein
MVELKLIGGDFRGDNPIHAKRHCTVADTIDLRNFKDRGGRRSVPDRRKSSSSDHRYRRSGSDRRSLQNLKVKKKMERRRAFKEKYSS